MAGNLGVETLRGLYPVETISTAEKVFNQDFYFKRTMKYVGEPMIHLESIASSPVRILFLFIFQPFVSVYIQME
uniref:Uncharacterized protein n=1 Tax=Triticum urartu TaxID=4572 RepID=A0A8R7TP07_TRIUA